MNTHSSKVLIQSMVAAFAATLIASVAMANPQGGQVAQGKAHIGQESSKYTKIEQSSEKAVINWDSFNIGRDEHTQFVQPSSDAVTLNRVNAKNGASAIQGKMTANGQVYLINPAGIVFGKLASVDVGGLLATTADITDNNFMKGELSFKQSDEYPTSSISNFGNITAKEGGMVVLVAPGVENDGIIQAQLGIVVLGATNQYKIKMLDTYGDQLIYFVFGEEGAGISQKPIDSKGEKMKSAVSNSGAIVADGGSVMMTAVAAKNVVDNMINMEGYIQADTVNQRLGIVSLDVLGKGGKVVVSGEISAQGKGDGGGVSHGGLISIDSGWGWDAKKGKVILDDQGKLNVSSLDGGGSIFISSEGKNKFGPETQVLADAIGATGYGGWIEILGKKNIVDGEMSAAGSIDIFPLP